MMDKEHRERCGRCAKARAVLRLGLVHVFELQAVRIGEEDSVIGGAILRIFGGRIEDRRA